MRTRAVFGYGSLIFRPDLDFMKAEWACLRGFSRRFYQGSVDHRGTEQRPGRVVTLLPDADAHCWGVAYHLSEDTYDAMVERLDRREVGGYDRSYLPLTTAGGGVLEGVLVYCASPENPGYLGPAPLKVMAEQIQHAHGPSGSNREYLLRLADALRGARYGDAHVEALADAVRALGTAPGAPSGAP